MEISALQWILGKGNKVTIPLTEEKLNQKIGEIKNKFDLISNEDEGDLNIWKEDNSLNKELLETLKKGPKSLETIEQNWTLIRTIYRSDVVNTILDKREQKEKLEEIEKLAPTFSTLRDYAIVILADLKDNIFIGYDIFEKVTIKEYWEKVIEKINSFGLSNENSVKNHLNLILDWVKEETTGNTDAEEQFEKIAEGKEKALEELNKILELSNKKNEFQKKIEQLINDYATPINISEAKLEELNDKMHWGDDDRGGDGGTWRDYLAKVDSLESFDYTSLPTVESDVIMGFLDAVVPEIIRCIINNEKGAKKSMLTGLMAEEGIAEVNYFNQTQTRVTKIDNAKFEDKTVEKVIETLPGISANEALLAIQAFFTKKPNFTWDEIKKEGERILGETGDLMKDYDLEGNNFDADVKSRLTLNTSYKGIIDEAVNIDNEGELSYNNKERWLNYEAFTTAGGGNCFLNSFVTILTENNDGKNSVPLRAALCLNLMTKKDWWVDDDAEVQAKDVVRLLNQRKEKSGSGLSIKCRMAYDGDYFTGQDIQFMANLLERPIVLICRSDGKKQINKKPYCIASQIANPITTSYHEPWFVWHASEDHFETLVRPEEHQEGTLKFKAKDIVINDNDTNPSVLFTFDKGIDVLGFTTKNKAKLETEDDINILDREKIRISYNKDDKWSEDKFNALREMLHDSDGEIDKKEHTFGINLFRTFSESMEINSVRTNSDGEIIIDWDQIDHISIENKKE